VHTTNYSAADAVTALGANHGYCLDGDFVHLNADVSLAEADLADGTHWALQLWASPGGFDGRGLTGVKVAELALQPTPGNFNVAACVTALPPAGCTAQIMAMALVGQRVDGSVQVRDLSVYATPQTFFQPFLLGDVSCRVADGVAEIAIERIASPRSPDNLSGTLALEVWALDAPYQGGAWQGQPVASVVLGQLSGGSAWADCRYSVPAANAGGALTLMLREWTPAGYLTRDYRNLAAAVVEPLKVEVKEAAKAGKGATKKAGAGKPAEKTGPVSVNTASAAELAAVKGISKALAEAIVAARPYARLDDLLRAKGIGAKLLEKVGKLLTI